MSIAVDFVLRANSSQFTRAVAGAESRLNSLKRGLSRFGGGNLAGAIGITGLIAGFGAALKNAQAMRSELEAAGMPVDGLVRNTAELADAFDSAGEAVKRFSVSALGALAEVGAKARRAMQGISREQEDEARRMARSTERDAIAAEQRLAEARRANSPEKIAEAERKLADLRRENAMKASDAEGRLVLLLMRKNELEKERDALGAKTVARLEKEAEIMKAAQAVEEQRAVVARQAAADAEIEKQAREEIAGLQSRRRELLGTRDAILKEQATAKADRILPTIEDLAARATQNRQARANYGIGSEGSLVSELDPNDPALRAERALELEEKARAAALSGDPVQRLQMAGQFQAEAEELRASLAGSVRSRDSDIEGQFKSALTEVEAKLEEIAVGIKDWGKASI
jgi:hypothetical protein